MVLKKQEKHHNFQRDNIFKLYKFIKILQPNTVVGFVLFLNFNSFDKTDSYLKKIIK
jgi:hypothetical protein